MDNKLSGFLFNKIGVADSKKFLDLTSLRHKLISSNVANVSTNGYEACDIDFKRELSKASGNNGGLAGTVTNSAHIPTGHHAARAPKVERTRVANGDVNSVDIDREVPKMAENELMYTIAARLLEKKFAGLRKVITSK